MEQIAEKLFNILNTKFTNSIVKTLDENGKETSSMKEIRIFSFDFMSKHKNYGPVVLLLSAKDNLEVYYGDNTSRILDSHAKKKWENFIEHISVFARSNRLGFSLKHLSKLKYDLNNIVNIEESYKKLFESYYGTSKTSYNKQGNAKIIIKHSKTIGENDARYRNISSIFIENESGERFKLPFTKLMGARAMARHVSEGGNPYDLLGVHICELVQNINTLGGFVRRSKIYEDNDEVSHLIEASRSHYKSLKKSLKKLAGKRSYYEYKENWTPSQITETDTDISSIRDLFLERRIDLKIEEALPILSHLYNMSEFHGVENKPEKKEENTDIKEINEFKEWVDSVVEGNLTRIQIEELIDFFNEKRPYGVDGLNIIGLLQDVIDVEDLREILITNSQKNPGADARPIIAKWIKDNIPAYKNLIQSNEGLNNELDADEKRKLNANVNKEIDKYSNNKKVISSENKEQYMDEETTQQDENYPDYNKENISENDNDEMKELNELIKQTNFLLNK